MRIGIDISQVLYKTGVSKYIDNLIRNLLTLDTANDYVLYAGTLRQGKAFQKYFDSLPGDFTPKLVPFMPPTVADFVFNRLRVVPIERFVGKVDIFHSSDWTQPPTSAKCITTVHDLSPILHPEYTPKSVVEVHKRKLYWTKKQADGVIVPSNSTKADLVKLGFDDSKVHVIYEAANYHKASKKQVLKVKRKYKIPGDYALALGVHPRKNTERIITAFENASAGRDMRLVLVGTPVEVSPKEGHKLRFTGRVESDIEMRALYTGARVVVFPSLYEGFGIPILDAFACETPVVTSAISSMVEIAGDAAVLVDPTSVSSISEGITEALSKQKTLIGKGTKRLTAFSWEKMARETMKLYDQIS